MSISSLLSESSTPTLTRRSSFSESATESDHEEGGSETSEDIEAATPTPEDIALMRMGSQASAMLKRIQENSTDLEDIIELLVTKMAILILPTCAASVSEPTRSTFEDHVITPKSQDSEWLFETLSGIRLKPTSVSSIAILDSVAGNGEGTSTTTKTSQSAIISLVPNSEESRPVANGSPGAELRLVNTSASPIQISIPSVGPVSVLLVNSIIPAPSVRSHYTVPPKRPAAINSSPSSTTDPLKKRRRRRITTEEASRVIIEGSEDDPNARARYKCSECDKTFSRPFNLRSHRATHAGIKPYKCTYVHGNGVKCHWEFARRHDLDRHMSSRHSFEKPFKCGTCGATCGRNDSLKRHYEKNPTCAEAASRGLAPQPQPQNQPLSLSSAPIPTQTPPPSLSHPIFDNN
ncbi:hypothetical protein BGZ80_003248 [Entomortierella chlamydospora]|uniref:C2H2-type domain-containing protein n=1 Tax=Entomortierella chlamydospora TaxID=101097 RepID=A0A9P6SWL3_9FUNG|nr:hypothetical protein BGZ79_001129 [Entomortierella chlamydospora]KAG0008617.1 hypothetical protein BGZ80_003248 [Entomortierella chlamydospora]